MNSVTSSRQAHRILMLIALGGFAAAPLGATTLAVEAPVADVLKTPEPSVPPVILYAKPFNGCILLAPEPLSSPGAPAWVYMKASTATLPLGADASVSPTVVNNTSTTSGGSTVNQCMNVAHGSLMCKNDCTGVVKEEKFVGTGATPQAARDDLAAKMKCPKGTTETGSVIDNMSLNHRHSALDYASDSSQGSGRGCGSCGSAAQLDSPDQAFAKVALVRIHSPRDMTQPSSHGPGVFSAYDISLTLFAVNGVTYIDCYNPLWLAARRYSPSGTRFIDAVYDSVRSVVLKDASGADTVSMANAVTAIYTTKGGEVQTFELFALDANRKGGRLVSTKSAGGVQVLTLAYATPAADVSASPESKWQRSSVTDLNGNTLAFNYAPAANGQSVVSQVTAPGNQVIRYSYDAGANLTAVDYPNGDRSAFVREALVGGARVIFSEAGEQGTHRNKVAYYTNNIATNLTTTWTDRPQVFNQSSMLVRTIVNGAGETVYASTNGGNGTGGAAHRKVYEGGGRLRFIDGSWEGSHYKTWSVPNGWSATDPFGSIVATKEKNGHFAPFADYAANRSGRFNKITTPDGVVSTYLYDGNGNMRLAKVGDKIARGAADVRFNKPTMSVDFSGKATLMAYDEAGNLVSRKTGWVYDAALPAGTPVSGLKCAYYENVAVFADLDVATPLSVQQSDSIALGQRVNAPTNWGMRFTGKLVLNTAGVRTFNLHADDKIRLYIDGVQVIQALYADGAKSVAVNLTAGAHDIRVDFIDLGGAQRLDLTWSGPETTDAAGNVATTIIGSNFLAHDSVADELTLRATPAAAEETWTYYPTGHALAGLQAAYVDAAGKRTEYEYDANRRLVAIKETGDTGALVTIQTRTYDVAGNLATVSDALGRTVTHAYDARNRRIKTTYGDTTTETVTYGTGTDANLVVAEKDRAGAVTKHEYDAAGRRVKTLRGYALADNDGVITQVLPNPSVEHTLYLNGTTDPIRTVRDGKVTAYDYDYRGRVTATRTFPANGKVLESVSVISADELRFMERDAHGCRTFYAYRAADKQLVREVRELVPGALGALADEAAVLAVARATGANPAFAVTDYERDGDGRVTATIDPLGVRTVTTYDAAGRVIATTRAAGTAVAATSTTTYDAAGRVVAQADALGRTTTRTYTPAGRVASVVYPDAKTEEFTYYGDGKLATRKDADGFTSKQKWSVCCGRDFASANPKGEGQLKFYDGPGRVTYAVSVKDVEAAASFVNFSTGISLPADAVTGAQTMKYDARGRLVASTKWLTVPAAVNPHAAPIATDPAQGLTTTYAYYDDLTDARFAPVLTKLAAQGVTLTAGSATVVTNPAGESSFSVQDGAGRTVATGAFNK